MLDDLEAPELADQVDRLQSALAPSLAAYFAVHYRELKRVIRHERGRQLGAAPTLNTTALVHELYLKLLQAGGSLASDKHFFALSALAVRRILVDAARHRQHVRAHATEMQALSADAEDDAELIEVHEALAQLRRVNPRLAAVVTCRWFAGYTEAETAHALGTAERTVRRDWERARIWMHAALSGKVLNS